VTKAGVKLSITSIVSIVSTQVAPRLHHAHKKEGQLGTLLIDHILAFYWKLNGLRYSHVFSLVQDKNYFRRDCTFITVGVSVYFTAIVPGALFGCGDFHAVMDDGEIIEAKDLVGWAEEHHANR